MTIRARPCAVLAVCSLALGARLASAALPPEALRIVRRIAIQDNGREKPFDSFAREALSRITGAPTRGSEDPVETALSILALPDHWQAEPLVLVPFVPLREALGMPPGTSRISYVDLVASRKLMRLLPPIVQKQQREEKLTMLEQETMDAFDRFVSLNHLLEQRLTLVPPPASSMGRAWLPVLDPDGYGEPQRQLLRAAWTEFLAAVRRHDAPVTTLHAGRLAEALRAVNVAAYPAPWRLELEVAYNRWAPFHAARLAYGLAALGLLLGLAARGRRTTAWGWRALWVGFLLHGAGIALRVIIGGRPPVSNFFETTLWLPFVAVTVALIFERVYQTRYMALAASLLAVIMLVLADYLPLDSGISPVVAVLNNTFWLTIHVLTIVASYGALTLATMLAHIYGWLYLTRRRRARSALARLDTLLYRAMQVGVVLLAGGVMLGAVWANSSWGRYWGWDPKETWALITLLWFLAILHGRFAGWLRGVGVALSTIGGFFLLLMTYYGVSFYLVGLHSYAGGHAKPLPLLLIAYLIAESAFLALVGAVALRRRPA